MDIMNNYAKKSKRTISFICLIVTITAGAAASDELQPTFRGLKFGEDVRAQVPACSGGSSSFTCRDVVTGGSPRIWFKDKLSDLIAYGGIVEQENDRMSAIWFYFKVTELPMIVNIFSAKYGTPASDNQKPWQSVGGTQITARTIVWKSNGLVVSIQAPDDQIDRGKIHVSISGFLERKAKELSEDIQRRAGDL